MVCPAAAADLAKLKVGTLAVKNNDSALFRVVSVSSTSFTVELAAANGSATAAPAAGDVLNIVSTPMAEGSNPGDGDETGITGSANYNCTQIFRKDIILTGSTLAVNVFGNADNQLNRQTAFALSELARDLNRVALFGVRAEAGASVRGTAGGLYEFGTGTGSLAVNASGDRLESCIINDAAQKIMGAGGEPTQILCSPGQARVLSGEYKSQLQILRAGVLDDQHQHIGNDLIGTVFHIDTGIAADVVDGEICAQGGVLGCRLVGDGRGVGDGGEGGDQHRGSGGDGRGAGNGFLSRPITQSPTDGDHRHGQGNTADAHQPDGQLRGFLFRLLFCVIFSHDNTPSQVVI
jgi:hypothetical protein